MTDTQIMESLKRCVSERESCSGCAYHGKFDGNYCSQRLIKDAVLLINRQAKQLEKLKQENDHRKNVITLLEQDVADRDDMLKRKVEEVYADFMNDYKIMSDELNTLYDKNVTHQKDIGRLRTILEKIPQTICDHTYPDFDKDGKPVNVWKANEGYDAIDALFAEQIVKEAAT